PEPDRVSDLARSIMAVHTRAQRVAHGRVALGPQPDRVSLRRESDRNALHARQRLADIETELGVKREGAAVIGGLHQSEPGRLPLLRPSEDVFHERPTDSAVLQ